MCIFAVLLVNKYLSSSELELILINIKRNNNYYYTIKTSFIHIYNSILQKFKGLQGKNYKERLSILKLPSLECRRAYADVVFLYKILNGLCDNNLSSLFSKSTLSIFISLRRHSLQVSLPKPRTDLLKFSFCYRSAKLWNTLPKCIIKTTSISKFKQLVFLYLCDLYSK